MTQAHSPFPSSIPPRDQLVQGPEIDDDRIDLRALFHKVWRGKWIIAIFAIVSLAFGVVAISQYVPEYRASAKVMFGGQQTKILDVEELLVNPEFNRDTLTNEVEVLRSTNLVGRVVDELRLDQNPVFNPALRPPEPSLLDRISGGLTVPPEIEALLMNIGVIRPPAPVPTESEAERRLRLRIINNVTNGLGLQPIRGSRVIEISYTSVNPRLSAQIVNEVAEQYIVEQLDSKLEATRSATEWLSGRVEELRVRVQTAEEDVEELRAELSLQAGQSLGITQQQLEALNGELSAVRARASQTEAQFDRLSQALASQEDLGGISEFRTLAIVQALRQQEAAAQSQLANLRTTVPDTHPAIVRLERQLGETRSTIRTEAARMVSAIALDLDTQRSQEAAILEELRALEAQALAQSRDEVRLRQLEREAQSSRLLYENFLGRLKETSEQDDLQSADARVLSPAEPPLRPLSSKRERTLALAGIVGVMIGTGVVFLLDMLNNAFRSPKELESMSGQTVLATLPAVGSRLARYDVVSHFRDKPNSSLAEAIRNLRTSILFSNVDRPPEVIMFTSAVPREGKSTTSTLMALTSQQMGKRTIIVDCDLRLPSLTKLMRVDEDQPGLMSVLEGVADIDAAIQTDPGTDLDFLMVRKREIQANINAADILSSKKFAALIAQLRDTYDLVILDTPPTLVVTDARILSSLADAVVFAVRWDSTPRGAVLEGIKELQSVKAPLVGVAMTLVNESRASSYTYDGYQYYRGKYKNYYVQ